MTFLVKNEIFIYSANLLIVSRIIESATYCNQTLLVRLWLDRTHKNHRLVLLFSFYSQAGQIWFYNKRMTRTTYDISQSYKMNSIQKTFRIGSKSKHTINRLRYYYLREWLIRVFLALLYLSWNIFLHVGACKSCSDKNASSTELVPSSLSFSLCLSFPLLFLLTFLCLQSGSKHLCSTLEKVSTCLLLGYIWPLWYGATFV